MDIARKMFRSEYFHRVEKSDPFYFEELLQLIVEHKNVSFDDKQLKSAETSHSKSPTSIELFFTYRNDRRDKRLSVMQVEHRSFDLVAYRDELYVLR